MPSELGKFEVTFKLTPEGVDGFYNLVAKLEVLRKNTNVRAGWSYPSMWSAIGATHIVVVFEDHHDAMFAKLQPLE